MATIAVTTDTFEQTVQENDIVLVDFWAEWCPPCKKFGPIFEQTSEKHEDVAFAKVDTDAEQVLAQQAGIVSIPTVMAFREGVLVFNQPGALSGKQLEEVLGAVRDLDMDEVRAKLAEQQV